MVQLAHDRAERRAVKPPVILEPAADDWQLFESLIATRRYFPAPNRVSDRLRRRGGNSWTEVQEDLAIATLWSSRSELIPQKIKFLVGVFSFP